MTHPMSPAVGSTVTCAETGKQFVVQTDGFTFNYAMSSAGEVLSEEGVNLREQRALLDRSRPFGCYLSDDGKHVTSWKGNELGVVVSEGVSRTGWHGSAITYIRARDVHGGLWYGKGAGRGQYITLRAVAAKRQPY